MSIALQQHYFWVGKDGVVKHTALSSPWWKTVCSSELVEVSLAPYSHPAFCDILWSQQSMDPSPLGLA